MGAVRRLFEQLLVNSGGIAKVEFQFGIPPLKLVLEKTEFLEMVRSPQIASRTLARCFVERRVFWIDFHHEPFDFVVKSLREVEPLLDVAERELSSSRDLVAIGWGRFVGAWRSQVVQTRKQLDDALLEIDEEKAADLSYDSAWEDRDAALRKALIDLRLRVYPLVVALIDVLNDDDPMKEMASEKLDEGMALLNPRQIRGIEPEVTAA